MILLRRLFLQLIPISICTAAFGQAASPQALEPRKITVAGQHLIWRRLGETFTYPKINLGSNPVTLIVHSTDYWHPPALLKANLKKLVNLAHDQHSNIFYLASRDELASLAGQTRAGFWPYEGDSHFIKTNGSVTIAGGNFTQCMCNAVRSSILLNGSQRMNINLITDAIWEIPFPSVLSEAVKAELRPGIKDRNLLSELLIKMTDEQFIAYLKADWISWDTLPCPMYQPALLEAQIPQKYQYLIIRNGRPIGTIGPTSGKLITLNFLSVDDLKAVP